MQAIDRRAYHGFNLVVGDLATGRVAYGANPLPRVQQKHLQPREEHLPQCSGQQRQQPRKEQQHVPGETEGGEGRSQVLTKAVTGGVTEAATSDDITEVIMGSSGAGSWVAGSGGGDTSEEAIHAGPILLKPGQIYGKPGRGGGRGGICRMKAPITRFRPGQVCVESQSAGQVLLCLIVGSSSAPCHHPPPAIIRPRPLLPPRERVQGGADGVIPAPLSPHPRTQASVTGCWAAGPR